jgi:hypothetical protein
VIGVQTYGLPIRIDRVSTDALFIKLHHPTKSVPAALFGVYLK